jgi:hypothetical protein
MSESIQVSKSVSFTLLELLILSGSCFVLLIGLIGFLVYLSYRDREKLNAVAEDFERSVLSEASIPKQSPEAMTPPAPAAAPPPQAAPAPARPHGSIVDALVQRLRAMGLIGDHQHAVSLGFGPDGQVYALKAGGTVLILPRMESEAFLAHAARTHVMIVVPTSEGGALVITPLGQQMSVSVEERVWET